MPPVKKDRLDKLVVDRGLCASRAQAQALIMDGKVKVDGKTITKPGSLVPVDGSEIDIAGLQRYVSRGGLKLEKALEAFQIRPQGRVCLDIGAATGGFTDCLLQNGAAHVIAVDVGYGQLDWKLRNDSRVTVLEKTNIRDIRPEQLAQQASLGVVDTSFISLKKVLPSLSALLTPQGDLLPEMMTLLKPQFEHRDYLSDPGFKGVVRGADNHRVIIMGVVKDLETLLPEWRLLGLDFSPITGPKGNIEYLLHWKKGGDTPNLLADNALPAAIDAVIARSYDSLLSKPKG